MSKFEHEQKGLHIGGLFHSGHLIRLITLAEEHASAG